MKILPVAALIGDGKARFQPIYVDDVVKATILAAKRDDKLGRSIELGGPEYYNYSELVNLILRTIKKKRLKLPLPLWLMKINALAFNILPKPPLTPATIELFSFDNGTPDPQIIEHEFGFKPASLKPYLAEHGIKI
jgi:NADH dehydrogenase